MTRAKKRKLARQQAEYRRLLAMRPDDRGRVIRARLTQRSCRLRRCLGPFAVHFIRVST